MPEQIVGYENLCRTWCLRHAPQRAGQHPHLYKPVMSDRAPALLELCCDVCDAVLIPARPKEKPVHTCHAKGCEIAVAPKFLMCLRHWKMVPAELQRAVWAHYRPGQEISKDPTHEYQEAARAAIDAVAALEEANEQRGSPDADRAAQNSGQRTTRARRRVTRNGS
jgi:hypothetical protein